MDFTLFYVAFISFVATLVRSTLGFGESLIAVPLFIIFLPLTIAVPLSVLLSIVIALVVVIQDHRKIHIRSAKWLIIFALFGIPLGLILLVYGNESLVKIGLGTVITGYALYALWDKSGFRLKKDHMGWLFACGFLSGVLGGAYGLNGPPLVVYGNMRRWSAPHFRATLQAYFLPVSVAGAIGYWAKGLVTIDVFRYFVIALPAAIPAIFLGRYFNRRLNKESFFMYVYIGLLCVGIFILIRAFYSH